MSDIAQLLEAIGVLAWPAIIILLLLRQLNMSILSGIINFRVLKIIANMRRSFSETSHK